MKKILSTLLAALLVDISVACTNFIVTKSVSGGCGNMISYSADSHSLYGCLYHFPAADHPEGSYREVYDWDSGKFLGKIPEVSHTYNVVGNMNEFQVTIGESTFGGLHILEEPQEGAIIDYGSMIYIALQRSKTAREAIKVMTELAENYGYASEGESFSIGDKNELWIMEVIGKGKFGKGMVWVARRVPDGYICGHANQARITTFDFQKENKFDDPKAQTFNSPDVVQFAIDNNLYSGSVKDFSFSDVYNPVDFEGARFCDIRVWAFFAEADPDNFGKNKAYWDYAKGNVLRDKPYEGGCQTKANFPKNRMPLWIKPKNLVTVHGLMNAMRNHLENTELDMSKDFGAGPFECPYRMRPLTFESNGKEYFNERATATQQTGWVYVAQMRNWLPDFYGGVFWFATDDAANTEFFPFYSTITKVPEEFAEGNGSLTRWSDNSSFWINNLISNFAYSRYNEIHPIIEKIQQRNEKGSILLVEELDSQVSKMSESEAVKHLTEMCCKAASLQFKQRKELFQQLFMKFMDGNCKEINVDGLIYDLSENPELPKIQHIGYGQKWYDEIVKHTGDKLLLKK